MENRTQTTTNSLQGPTHELKSLGQIVATLAKIYRFQLDDDVLEAYFIGCGHRSLEDLNEAYKAILRNEDIRFMPTPGQLRAACGLTR